MSFNSKFGTPCLLKSLTIFGTKDTVYVMSEDDIHPVAVNLSTDYPKVEMIDIRYIYIGLWTAILCMYNFLTIKLS